jgi:uncharacterized repeat protein (TIGR03803 family)
MRHHGAATVIFALAILAVAASVAAAQETILYDFGAAGTPTTPNTALVFDADGNLYGTAPGGLAANGSVVNSGVAYELSPNGEGAWTEKQLFVFSEKSSGLTPNGLIFDAKKINLYGTTQSGGANNRGTVFELSPNGGGTWKETVLCSFGATGSDGNAPQAGLVFDSFGNLYGTTESGGTDNQGVVFELSPLSGGTWTESVLYSFLANGSDGESPRSNLIFDANGSLYGTTHGGGSSLGQGTVFQLSLGGYGIWAEHVLHTFAIEHTSDASDPVGGLVIDKAGNLYGAAAAGGVHSNGAVYKLSPASGGTWTETLVYSFNGTGSNKDGISPDGGVVFDAKGNLFGTTFNGGTYNSDGTIYELIPSGGSWTEKVLYDFDDHAMNDGFNPAGNLTLDAHANLYGVSTKGGTNSEGTAFKFPAPVPKAATPTFSPVAGIYAPGTAVRILDSTPGADIYYTTDGDTPTETSTKYKEPIEVSKTETIKAVAFATGYTESAASSAKYTIEPATAEPMISPAAGKYTKPQTVRLTDKTAGAAIYYTTNGTVPTAESKRYTGAITVSANETVKAIAVASEHAKSTVASVAYIIDTATPVIAPNGGTFTKAQIVKITDATAGSAIYYTTTGATPTTASKKYTGQITVSANETIKAIAIAADHAPSAEAAAKFTIN